MEILSWSCALLPEGRREPSLLPYKWLCSLLQRARAWELSSVQAKTLPQDWRDMVFGAMSYLSDDSS